MSTLPSLSTHPGLRIDTSPEGIILSQFHSAERSAVDEWTRWIEAYQLQGLWYGKNIIHLLVDCRSIDKPPIRYFLECLSDYNREYPQLKPPKVRLAYVHAEQTNILAVFMVLADLIEGLEAEFFPASAYAQAKTWLLSNAAPKPRTEQEQPGAGDWR